MMHESIFGYIKVVIKLHFPVSICCNCVITLTTFYIFKKKCLVNNQQLIYYFGKHKKSQELSNGQNGPENRQAVPLGQVLPCQQTGQQNNQLPPNGRMVLQNGQSSSNRQMVQQPQYGTVLQNVQPSSSAQMVHQKGQPPPYGTVLSNGQSVQLNGALTNPQNRPPPSYSSFARSQAVATVQIDLTKDSEERIQNHTIDLTQPDNPRRSLNQNPAENQANTVKGMWPFSKRADKTCFNGYVREKTMLRKNSRAYIKIIKKAVTNFRRPNSLGINTTIDLTVNQIEHSDRSENLSQSQSIVGRDQQSSTNNETQQSNNSTTIEQQSIVRRETEKSSVNGETQKHNENSILEPRSDEITNNQIDSTVECRDSITETQNTDSLVTENHISEEVESAKEQENTEATTELLFGSIENAESNEESQYKVPLFDFQEDENIGEESKNIIELNIPKIGCNNLESTSLENNQIIQPQIKIEMDEVASIDNIEDTTISQNNLSSTKDDIDIKEDILANTYPNLYQTLKNMAEDEENLKNELTNSNAKQQVSEHEQNDEETIYSEKAYEKLKTNKYPIVLLEDFRKVKKKPVTTIQAETVENETRRYRRNSRKYYSELLSENDFSGTDSDVHSSDFGESGSDSEESSSASEESNSDSEESNSDFDRGEESNKRRKTSSPRFKNSYSIRTQSVPNNRVNIRPNGSSFNNNVRSSEFEESGESNIRRIASTQTQSDSANNQISALNNRVNISTNGIVTSLNNQTHIVGNSSYVRNNYESFNNSSYLNNTTSSVNNTTSSINHVTSTSNSTNYAVSGTVNPSYNNATTFNNLGPYNTQGINNELHPNSSSYGQRPNVYYNAPNFQQYSQNNTQVINESAGYQQSNTFNSGPLNSNNANHVSNNTNYANGPNTHNRPVAYYNYSYTGPINSSNTFNNSSTFRRPSSHNEAMMDRPSSYSNADSVNAPNSFNNSTMVNNYATMVNGPRFSNIETTINRPSTFNNAASMNVPSSHSVLSSFNYATSINGQSYFNNKANMSKPSYHNNEATMGRPIYYNNEATMNRPTSFNNTVNVPSSFNNASSANVPSSFNNVTSVIVPNSFNNPSLVNGSSSFNYAPTNHGPSSFNNGTTVSKPSSNNVTTVNERKSLTVATTINKPSSSNIATSLDRPSSFNNAHNINNPRNLNEFDPSGNNRSNNLNYVHSNNTSSSINNASLVDGVNSFRNSSAANLSSTDHTSRSSSLNNTTNLPRSNTINNTNISSTYYKLDTVNQKNTESVINNSRRINNIKINSVETVKEASVFDSTSYHDNYITYIKKIRADTVVPKMINTSHSSIIDEDNNGGIEDQFENNSDNINNRNASNLNIVNNVSEISNFDNASVPRANNHDKYISYINKIRIKTVVPKIINTGHSSIDEDNNIGIKDQLENRSDNINNTNASSVNIFNNVRDISNSETRANNTDSSNNEDTESSNIDLEQCPYPDCNTKLPPLALRLHKNIHIGFFCETLGCKETFLEKTELRTHLRVKHSIYKPLPRVRNSDSANMSTRNYILNSTDSDKVNTTSNNENTATINDNLLTRNYILNSTDSDKVNTTSNNENTATINEDTEDLESNSPGTILKCTFPGCDTRLPPHVMRFHKSIHNSGYTCQEPDCKRLYSRKEDLKFHVKRVHGIKLKFRYQCEICEKTYKIKKYLTWHMKLHNGDMYPCEFCDKEFTSSLGLKTHFQYAHDESMTRKYECDKCKRKFYKKCSLEAHKCFPPGVLHQCSYCDKKFRFITNKVQHEFIHKGIKKWECPQCNTKFLHNSHLKQHLLTHSGVKNFKCSVCSKAFSHNGSLRKHMEIHAKNV